jgi:hypothetical protein
MSRKVGRRGGNLQRAGEMSGRRNLKLKPCSDPRVFVTDDGSLGLCVKGRAITMSVERWHELALKCC